MFKFKVDEEIELKILEIRHAEDDYKLINENREHLREWLPWVDNIKDVEGIKKFIKTGLEQYANNGGFHAGIWYKGDLAGSIGYYGINWHNNNIGIGYWLGSQYEGKGIMTRACKAMVDYAIKELGLHRVEIRCAEENLKSGAIPQRLGFVEEGIIREAELLNDRYVNHRVYGILKEEWLNSSSSHNNILPTSQHE